MSFVDLLLRLGAKLLPDNQSRTPVHIAVIKSNLDILRVMMSSCKDENSKREMLEAKDTEGFTPLMTAVWQVRNFMENSVQKRDESQKI